MQYQSEKPHRSNTFKTYIKQHISFGDHYYTLRRAIGCRRAERARAAPWQQRPRRTSQGGSDPRRRPRGAPTSQPHVARARGAVADTYANGLQCRSFPRPHWATTCAANARVGRCVCRRARRGRPSGRGRCGVGRPGGAAVADRGVGAAVAARRRPRRALPRRAAAALAAGRPAIPLPTTPRILGAVSRAAVASTCLTSAAVAPSPSFPCWLFTLLPLPSYPPPLLPPPLTFCHGGVRSPRRWL